MGDFLKSGPLTPLCMPSFQICPVDKELALGPPQTRMEKNVSVWTAGQIHLLHHEDFTPVTQCYTATCEQTANWMCTYSTVFTQ